MATATKSQTVAADIAALLRARNPLLWVVSREEARVESYLFLAAEAAGYIPHTWDVAQGVCDLAGKSEPFGSPDPGEMLKYIGERATSGKDRGLWIMRDLPSWLSGPGSQVTTRTVRNLARMLPGIAPKSAQALVVLSPTSDVPSELAGHATVIEWPMPDRAEIEEILDIAIDTMPDDLKAKAAPNGMRDAAIDAAVGLSGEEAQACYSRSLVQLKRIDVPTVTKEKKRIIARERVLEWYDPLPGGLDAVGGLENLKTWLMARSAAYTPEARAYGLPAPKGVLLAGIPGCGKSLTAKAVSTAWNCPLIKCDLGALKSKFVGESEANLRKAFNVIAALGRVVVWFDEIEKSLQGATSGSADGGVSSDALGAILSWMQERQGEAFVIATANDAEALPAELLRKGRFDEVWWVDTPTAQERRAVLIAALASHGRAGAGVGFDDRIIEATDGFTGSEIAALVPDAMFAAFNDGKREITEGDLLTAAKTVVPLTKTAEAKIKRLRDWANGRARLATRADDEAPSKAKARRQLDI